jgi:hypothetical protein
MLVAMKGVRATNALLLMLERRTRMDNVETNEGADSGK